MTNSRPPRPIRTCRNKTGPREESFTATPMMTRTGASKISAADAARKSKTRLRLDDDQQDLGSLPESDPFFALSRISDDIAPRMTDTAWERRLPFARRARFFLRCAFTEYMEEE